MRPWSIAVLLALAACGSDEPAAETAAPAVPEPSRFETGAHTARTAKAQLDAAQAQAQARLDSQMQAVADTTPAP